MERYIYKCYFNYTHTHTQLFSIKWQVLCFVRFIPIPWFCTLARAPIWIQCDYCVVQDKNIKYVQLECVNSFCWKYKIPSQCACWFLVVCICWIGLSCGFGVPSSTMVCRVRFQNICICCMCFMNYGVAFFFVQLECEHGWISINGVVNMVFFFFRARFTHQNT